MVWEGKRTLRIDLMSHSARLLVRKARNTALCGSRTGRSKNNKCEPRHESLSKSAPAGVGETSSDLAWASAASLSRAIDGGYPRLGPIAPRVKNDVSIVSTNTPVGLDTVGDISGIAARQPFSYRLRRAGRLARRLSSAVFGCRRRGSSETNTGNFPISEDRPFRYTGPGIRMRPKTAFRDAAVRSAQTSLDTNIIINRSSVAHSRAFMSRRAHGTTKYDCTTKSTCV